LIASSNDFVVTLHHFLHFARRKHVVGCQGKKREQEKEWADLAWLTDFCLATMAWLGIAPDQLKS